MGSLVCVGPGMIVGAHLSARCRNHIVNADIIFSSCHPLMEDWLKSLNNNFHSLQSLYGENKDRRITYQQMITRMMSAVREGKRVVGVFYGHPGVFAQVPHQAIAQAREEGFTASMEPGISAEDCLYADLGIDPGAYGCQHMETTQFMIYQRVLDTCGYVILWQVALAGDISLSKRMSSSAERKVLVKLLMHFYPPDHSVTLYECPTLITDTFRAETIPLEKLTEAKLSQVTTLVIPPANRLIKNDVVSAELAAISKHTGDKI